ncbi:MAG: hypothetical protein DMF65_05990 [Acidobacteria bacterium]|nr:MAG: hypothetical protein DMF65_05990 [Acidobacteriota bacterium]
MTAGLFKRIMRAASRVVFVAAAALVLGACAAMTRPAGTGLPRASEPPKFAVLAASDERLGAALASWKTIVGEQNAASTATPELEPVTATVKSLPANLPTQPRMPLVRINDKSTKSDEETRESLRRFMASAAPLVGAGLQELSLVGVVDAAGGAKTARYRQNSFPYPLRNGFGEVEVTFTPDLRVVGLSSTAIPDAERLRRALAAVTQTLSADKAAAALDNRTITFTDPSGAQRTHAVTQAETKTAQRLVVFPVRRGGADPATLELHVAWEVSVGVPTSMPLVVYVDAATGDVLAATVGMAVPAGV